MVRAEEPVEFGIMEVTGGLWGAARGEAVQKPESGGGISEAGVGGRGLLSVLLIGFFPLFLF